MAKPRIDPTFGAWRRLPTVRPHETATTIFRDYPEVVRLLFHEAGFIAKGLEPDPVPAMGIIYYRDGGSSCHEYDRRRPYARGSVWLGYDARGQIIFRRAS